MVGGVEGAAAVGGDDGVVISAFGEAMEVAVVDGAEIVVFEELEDGRGVGGAIGDVFAQGKMGEKDEGGLAVDFGQGDLGVLEGGIGDGDFLVIGALGGVEGEELPAAEVEGVIVGIGEGVIPGFVAFDHVVVAGDDVEGDLKFGEEGFEEVELGGGGILGEVAGDEEDVDVVGVEFCDEGLEVAGALVVEDVEIVEDAEAEVFARGVLGVEGAGPDGAGEQGSGGSLEEGATRKADRYCHGGKYTAGGRGGARAKRRLTGGRGWGCNGDFRQRSLPMPQPVAIVTGGSRGIGRGIALALGKAGWDVVVNYATNAAAAEAVVKEITAGGSRAVAVQADISLAADRDLLVDKALASFGAIELLVNNAGVAPKVRADLLDASEESFERVMNINLKGPYFLTQRVAREMIKAVKGQAYVGGRRPKIVVISSVSAYAASVNRGDYCVSKAGLAMMVKLYATRLAEYGINVYEIRPGVIDTDMTGAVKSKYDKLIAEGLTPIQRWGQAGDVARAVLAIAGDLLPFSTGEVINVDGGFHLRTL